MKWILTFVVITSLLLIGQEIFFRHLVAEKEKRNSWHYPVESSRVIQGHPDLGLVNVKESKIPFKFVLDGKVVREEAADFYTLDRQGRRTTHLKNELGRDHFFAFLGCSTTFGQGIRDHETMAHYMGELTTKYRPYNFGVLAYGPHHVLAQIELGHLKSEIKEQEGVAVYTYITDHIYRVTRSMGTLPTHAPGNPYYIRGHDQRPVRVPNAPMEDSLFNKSVSFLSQRKLLNYLGIEFPKFLDRDMEFFCSLVTKVRDDFTQQFPKGKFYVLFHPMDPNGSPEKDAKIKGCLEQAGILVLDYTGELEYNDMENWVMDHLHPSGKANKYVVERLIKDLRLNEVEAVEKSRHVE